jgi:hypothetical protein
MKKYAPYILITAAVMLPLLLPGYILTLDMVFTPELRLPGSVGNDYLWHALLHLLDLLLPSQLIQKAILLSIPLLAAIGMHRLLEYLVSSADGEPNPKPSRRLNRSGAGKELFETTGSKILLPRVSGLPDTRCLACSRLLHCAALMLVCGRASPLLYC